MYGDQSRELFCKVDSGDLKVKVNFVYQWHCNMSQGVEIIVIRPYCI